MGRRRGRDPFCASSKELTASSVNTVRYTGAFPMNPDQLAFGFLEYVVFLLSTTCHEAAHALVAKWGGDTTALEGGQVSLNPWPHIQREPFGMVVMPLIGIASGSGLIGWASAPYNPEWAMEHPKHAARMSLAGPVANFGIATLAGVLMRIGLAMGSFVPLEPSFSQIVGAGHPRRNRRRHRNGAQHLLLVERPAGLLQPDSVSAARWLRRARPFRPGSHAVRLQVLRMQMGAFSFLGLVIAWRVFDRYFDPPFRLSRCTCFTQAIVSPESR